jgi:hypothetical protein
MVCRTKLEAKTNSQKFYFPLKKCKRGHEAKRYVCNGKCVECEKLPNRKEYNKQNKRKWKLKYPEKARNSSRRYYQSHKQEISIKNKLWRKQHPLEAKERYYKRYAKHHKLYFAGSAKRRAQKLLAIPIWSDMKEITEFYKNCPVGMEVDHIVPLQHPLVCGLHVPWNLQYLSMSENRSKSNKFFVEA